MSPQDAAARLKMQVPAIYRLLKNGKLKGRQVAGRWQISERALDAYLASQTITVKSGRLNYGVAPDGEILWFEVK